MLLLSHEETSQGVGCSCKRLEASEFAITNLSLLVKDGYCELADCDGSRLSKRSSRVTGLQTSYRRLAVSSAQRTWRTDESESRKPIQDVAEEYMSIAVHMSVISFMLIDLAFEGSGLEISSSGCVST
jgi:hypothetical protein